MMPSTELPLKTSTQVNSDMCSGQPRLKIHILASGSRGNSTIIEDVASGRALVVDCGISKRAFFEKCAEVNVDVAKIEGFLITHEHGDHTKGIGVVLRRLNKLGVHPALYIGSELKKTCIEISRVQEICDIRYLHEGSMLSLAGISTQVFTTSHDVKESFGFRFEQKNEAIGYMTDTGVVTDAAYEALKNCRILALESNHDKHMLEVGPYPYAVKQRVASDRGHLSNDQAVLALEKLLHPRLEHVIAMHISENNNTYRIPKDKLENLAKRHDHPATISPAYQNRTSSFWR